MGKALTERLRQRAAQRGKRRSRSSASVVDLQDDDSDYSPKTPLVEKTGVSTMIVEDARENLTEELPAPQADIPPVRRSGRARIATSKAVANTAAGEPSPQALPRPKPRGKKVAEVDGQRDDQADEVSDRFILNRNISPALPATRDVGRGLVDSVQERGSLCPSHAAHDCSSHSSTSPAAIPENPADSSVIEDDDTAPGAFDWVMTSSQLQREQERIAQDPAYRAALVARFERTKAAEAAAAAQPAPAAQPPSSARSSPSAQPQPATRPARARAQPQRRTREPVDDEDGEDWTEELNAVPEQEDDCKGYDN
ncbi:hypothetical protein SISNIDRAFT_485766 [Sistotremastrum niveocremeum HHB9708]|uniref:Uncharacterized protein n=1 Tax=Sistotremastrum niveocremeum HHB9708 TaxID=1314777 RepID=A0A164UT89_9AGAM|nr:hypothetical protein SISNIDRAFT_485766 [Sistotremastrum niveocremeum HHB9708]